MKLNATSEQYFTRWEGKATLPRPPKRGSLGGLGPSSDHVYQS